MQSVMGRGEGKIVISYDRSCNHAWNRAVLFFQENGVISDIS